MSRRVCLLAIAILRWRMCSAAEPAHVTWNALVSIAGQWSGEGSGEPGRSIGSFPLKPDLGGAVLVRRSRAEYPATAERAAFVHEDLTVFHRAGHAVRAEYWDSEGHVIRYAVSASADGREITLLSDLETGSPRFRLNYAKVGADRLKVRFEMAPAGKPEQFAAYVEGTVLRK